MRRGTLFGSLAKGVPGNQAADEHISGRIDLEHFEPLNRTSPVGMRAGC